MAVLMLGFAVVSTITNVLGAPQMSMMEPCPNGPCAALFGPCTADSDCLGGNVCVDDMDGCMNMISPCCMMGSAAPRLSDDLPTIVEAASATPELSTLVTAVQAAGLVDTLNGEGPFTVFAPNNDAFAKLPAETLASLLEPENIDQLEAVLLRHVLPTVILAGDIPEGSTTVDTAGGETITVTNADGVTIESSAGKATVIATDVVTSNGVVHIVDTVF